VITDNEIKNILTRKGKVQLFKKPHKRYKSINQKDDDPKNTEERF